MKTALPSEGLDGGLRFRPDAGGERMHDGVFAMGLVPDRHHFDTGRPAVDDGLELSDALVGETIAHSEGVFFDFFHEGRRLRYFRVVRGPWNKPPGGIGVASTEHGSRRSR
jgi:hypothetical protein